MINELLSQVKERMNKSIEALKVELAKVRTGRANPALLEHVMVDCYGAKSPLNQVASVVVEDARTLMVKPWDKQLVPMLEKALLAADLGLNPSTSGDSIRVPLPPLTEERRKGMIKIVREEAEQGRIAIRNVRRDANTELKDMVKAKTLSEDDEKRALTQVQSATDGAIATIDEVLAAKEKDLMTI